MLLPAMRKWIVDGVDPQDGGVEVIFVPDLTEKKRRELNSACASWSKCPLWVDFPRHMVTYYKSQRKQRNATHFTRRKHGC